MACSDLIPDIDMACGQGETIDWYEVVMEALKTPNSRR